MHGNCSFGNDFYECTGLDKNEMFSERGKKISGNIFANSIHNLQASWRNKSEKEKSYISNLYAFYRKAKFCPAEENDEVNIEKLQAWTDKFKILLAESRQSNLYSSLMGRLFAFSPKGKDGYEPCEAVRCVIERDADDSFIREYRTAIFNKRGGFTPDAGKSERRIAEKYRDNADFLSMKYPKTAEIYYGLAKEYEIYSKEERVEAENGY